MKKEHSSLHYDTDTDTDHSLLRIHNQNCECFEISQLGNHVNSIKIIKASNNRLTLETFSCFTNLENLDLSFNQLHRITTSTRSFTHLTHLDLSYNFLRKQSGIENLGFLRNLVHLRLSGNCLVAFPDTFLGSTQMNEPFCATAFAKLETLYLNQNNLSAVEDFKIFATFPKLKYLNLAENDYRKIPLLGTVRRDQGESSRMREVHEVDDTVESETQPNYPGQNYDQPGCNFCHVKIRILDEFFSGSQLQQLIRLRERYSHLLPTGTQPYYSWRPNSHIKFKARVCHKVKKQAKKIEAVEPPFPELEQLDFSKNNVKFESNLLAVGVWPKLKRLIFCENPISKMANKILKSILAKRFDIQLQSTYELNELGDNHNKSKPTETVRTSASFRLEAAKCTSKSPLTKSLRRNPIMVSKMEDTRSESSTKPLRTPRIHHGYPSESRYTNRSSRASEVIDKHSYEDFDGRQKDHPVRDKINPNLLKPLEFKSNHHMLHRGDIPHSEEEFPICKEQIDFDNCRVDDGPLLPSLQWFVDETNLPETMQACLRELRDYNSKMVPTKSNVSDLNAGGFI